MVAVLVKAHAGNNPYARPEGAAEVASGMGHCMKDMRTPGNRCGTVSKLEGEELDEERLEGATICVKSKPSLSCADTHTGTYTHTCTCTEISGRTDKKLDQGNQGPRRRVETDFMCY